MPNGSSMKLNRSCNSMRPISLSDNPATLEIAPDDTRRLHAMCFAD